MGNIPNELPETAQLAFKGDVFEVWQWPQRMPDGSTVTFERMRRPATVIVFAVVADCIILQKQQQPTREVPYYSLPGGAGQWDEDPLSAAKRELFEETGYASQDWELIREQKPFSKMIWTISAYVARNCKPSASPRQDAGERIENQLVSFDELLSMADNPAFQDNAVIDLLLRAKFDPDAKQHLFGLLFRA